MFPPRRACSWGIALLLAAGSLLPAPSWADEDPAPPVAPAEPVPGKAEPAKPAAPTDPLVLGSYPITAEGVVDGDTVRLPKGNPSVRVLGIDCEEVLKREKDRVAAAKDFAAYAKAKRKGKPRPVKYGTPAGDAARDHAKALVKDATSMRLERDAVDAAARGYYGRMLAHVIIVKPTGEINLAVELVRRGHSPYFTKYGRSRRFDAEFRKAEAEARKAKLGIWGSTGPDHYPDYPERLAWWHARADQIDRWRALGDKPDRVTLGTPTTDAKLKALVGKEATVFGKLDRELKVSTDDRRVFLMSHVRGRGFPLVFFKKAVVDALDMDALDARYATVRGKITLHKGNPQMVIENANQISTK